MSREVWVTLWFALAILCARFYFEVWVNRKITRLLFGHYRNKQFLSPSSVSCFIGYNPFEAVKQVALRVGITPPELLVIPEFPHGVAAFCLGYFIVCSYPFVKNATEKEFEGVIGHEFGHLINKIEVFFRLAQYLFLGFLWCGGFLFFTFLGFAFSRIWEGEPLMSVDLMFLAGFFSCSFLLGGLCFVVYRILGKQREFSADKRALLLTRYPQDFLNRLVKIMSEEASGNECSVAGLFQDGHPPARKRVEAVKRILRKQNAVK